MERIIMVDAFFNCVVDRWKKKSINNMMESWQHSFSKRWNELPPTIKRTWKQVQVCTIRIIGRQRIRSKTTMRLNCCLYIVPMVPESIRFSIQQRKRHKLFISLHMSVHLCCKFTWWYIRQVSVCYVKRLFTSLSVFFPLFLPYSLFEAVFTVIIIITRK